MALLDWQPAWKVVNPWDRGSIVQQGKGRLYYDDDSLVSPLDGCGPIACFARFGAAKAFCDLVCGKILKVAILRSNEIHLWALGESTVGFVLPVGTVLAARVYVFPQGRLRS